MVVANASIFGTASYGIYRCADGFLTPAMTPIGRLAELLDCPTPHRFASSSSHLLMDKAMKSLDKFQSGL